MVNCMCQQEDAKEENKNKEKSQFRPRVMWLQDWEKVWSCTR